MVTGTGARMARMWGALLGLCLWMWLGGCGVEPADSQGCPPGVARNACGGCRPMVAGPGDGCGPCGLDRMVCLDRETLRCAGETSCGYGQGCTEDAQCARGMCQAGRCAPEGFAFVPGGRFRMGAPEQEPGRVVGETLHTVTIPHHLLVQSREVTQDQWRGLMKTDPWYFRGCGGDCPVEHVSWYDALAYANALSEAQGLERCYDLSSCVGTPGVDLVCGINLEVDTRCTGYRLPTEAEWEYAYRADATSAYQQGQPQTDLCRQPLLDESAQYCGNCQVSYSPTEDCTADGQRPWMPTGCGPAATGARRPNAWGLYDMAGNVEELVWDALGPYPEGGEVVDPTGPEHEGRFVVVRGGSFCSHMARLRAADRKYTAPGTRRAFTGFRLVRTLQAASAEELRRPGSCDNGCGGCLMLEAPPGSPCGPCGLDRYVCAGLDEAVCDGQTDCALGEVCQGDGDCPGGHCSNGHCAPLGEVFVPAGRGLLGSPPSEIGRRLEELSGEVRLTRHLLMQQYETSQGEWTGLMGLNPARFPSCGPSCPVENITYFQALYFANALSRTRGLPACYDLSICGLDAHNRPSCPATLSVDPDCTGYRLPTEAEWEYAYRADGALGLYNGRHASATACSQPLLDATSNYCGNCQSDAPDALDCSREGRYPLLPTACRTRPPAQGQANAWGLHDMAGNVAEFVFGRYDLQATPLVELEGPVPEGLVQVARGGGFCGQLAQLRAGAATVISRAVPYPDVGLRLVRTVRAASAEEMRREGSCDNGCGGCRTLTPSPGTPCGPCGLDRYVCDGANGVRCSASTSCEVGTRCQQDADCPGGSCSNGRCAPRGWAYIWPGTFWMGSPSAEFGRAASEALHEATLSRAFLMQTTEVTQAQWQALMGENPAWFTGCGDNCPVEQVRWVDALRYANALSQTHGLPPCYDLSRCLGTVAAGLQCPRDLDFSLDCPGFRLPTETEWEYAYRALSTSTYFHGAPDTQSNCQQPSLEPYAHFCGNCQTAPDARLDCSEAGRSPSLPSACGSFPVARQSPNPWGLYDMGGNVAEFVWDSFLAYSGQPTFDSKGPGVLGQDLVLRGGSMCSHYRMLRSAYRGTTSRLASSPQMGFRLVRSLPGP